MAGTELEARSSWVEEEFEKGLELVPHGDMHLGDLDEHHRPLMHYNHLLVDAPLEANWNADDPVERMTGRWADMTIPTSVSNVAGEGNSHHLSVVHLRQAQGDVFLSFAKALHEDDERPWFFQDLDGAVQFYRFAVADSNKPNRWENVSQIGDDHPINELPVFSRQKKTSNVEREIEYGCPASKVQWMRNAMHENGISYGMVKEGLYVKQEMYKQGVDFPEELEGVEEDSKNAYRRAMPMDDDVVSYVWRAFSLAKHLDESGYKNALNSVAMESMIMDTVAYSKTLEVIRRSGSLIAKLGIIDINDASMGSFLENAFGDQVDLTDPNVRKKIHGSLYIKQEQHTLQTPITYGMMGTAGRPIDRSGFKLFLRSGGEPNPYLGFQDLSEVRDELNGVTKIKGAPLIPIAAQINFPTSLSSSGIARGEHLLAIDPLKAPGVFMEAFIDSAPWMVRHYLNDGTNFTIDDILDGKFMGSTAGTAADLLARCAFGLINRSGDTTDSSGARTGYNAAALIEKGRGVAVNVPYPKPSDRLRITAGGLVPQKPFKLPAITARRKNKAEGMLVVGNGNSGSTSKLQFEDTEGFEPVVSVFSDAEYKLFVNAYKEKSNAKLSRNNAPEMPVPTVVVGKRKPKARG